MKNTLELKSTLPLPNDTSNEVISILDIGEEAKETPQKSEIKGPRGLVAFYQRLNERVEAWAPVEPRDKVTFFQLLAIMIEAGVPLVRSLYVLAEQLNKARMRRIVKALAQKVEVGKPLSDAMQDFYGIFNDSQIGMVRAGEASGRLNDILKQIALQTEKSAALASKVKGAMIYPIVIITLMIGAIFVILGYVVPQLMTLFTQTNTALPPSTQLLIALSEFVHAHYKMILGTVIVIAGLFYLWKRTPSGKYHWHQLSLRFPIFGRFFRYVALSRFTRTLSSLLQSGIPIVKSLQIDADAVGNEVYRRRLYLAAEDVSRGIPLAEHLTDSPFLFPEMVVSMIGIGEQTAELHQVTNKIADYYDAEVDQMSTNLSKLMEPLILVVMGVVVGGLILAVMQPIFGLLDVVGNL